nr:phospholipase D [Tanacetum cinerariifolium]
MFMQSMLDVKSVKDLTLTKNALSTRKSNSWKRSSMERRSAPFNGTNGAKFCVGPPRYYTRTDNRPPYGEKRPSLEEVMNKHQEESAQRNAGMKEWFMKLQENAEINTRNQSASFKNLET